MRILFSVFGVFTACIAPAVAQTPIGGVIYDGQGGPLVGNTVYHTTNHLTVPAGHTLTVSPGAIVKLAGHGIYVDGTMLAVGTAAEPVTFTSIDDDAAGGDTNGNGGATTPAPNQWRGISFRAGATANRIEHATIRYAGYGYQFAVAVDDAGFTMADSRVTDVGQGGVYSAPVSRPAVRRCAFERVAVNPAIVAGQIDAVPGYVDNTAVDCSGGAYLRIDDPTVMGTSVGIGPRHVPGGALVLANNVIVPAGRSLRIDADVVVKPLGGYGVYVDGTLECLGTATSPVVWTSFCDDTWGGDTNGDGNASQPGASQWRGLVLRAGSDASRIEHTVVRCAGYGYQPALDVSAAAPTLSACRVEDAGWGGVRLDATARPAVTDCSFARVGGLPAISGVDIGAVAAFADNRAVDCAVGNYLRIDGGTVAATASIPRASCMEGALVFAADLVVPAAATLTIEPGVVLKPLGPNGVYVDGTLTVVGTETDPVVITSIRDDTAGGDTNGDGNASQPGISQWRGVSFTDTADASRLEHLELRCTGYGYAPAIALNLADVAYRGGRVVDAGWGGMHLAPGTRPAVEDVAFERVHGEPAIYGLDLRAVAGFEDVEVAGCPGGAYMRVDHAALDGEASIAPSNYPGGALVINGNLHVSADARLVIGSGSVLKSFGAKLFDVFGHLEVYGLTVFTSFVDDQFGGDTNGDGSATSGGPNQWYGIHIHDGAMGVLDRALVRHAGYGYRRAIACDAPGFSLVRSRVEFSGYGGFGLTEARDVTDVIAYGNVGDGFHLAGGAFDVLRATSAYNTVAGFRSDAAWLGSVRSAIGHGNGGGDFVGFATGGVTYSNGNDLVGGAGNLQVDPRFVNAAVGDLRLASTSPCIDAGDPYDDPAWIDMLEMPRILDGKLDGRLRVDMGAHEYGRVRMAVSGAAEPGAVLTIGTAADPAIQLGALVIGLPPVAGTPFLTMGRLFVDLSGPYIAEVWPANGGVPLQVPAGLSTPLALAFQYVGLAQPFPRGNVSNPAFVYFR